tara:strand:+ start:351 stop:878 length:528 start_codon:yes stop_codon:yes gene_type:complete
MKKVTTHRQLGLVLLMSLVSVNFLVAQRPVTINQSGNQVVVTKNQIKFQDGRQLLFESNKVALINTLDNQNYMTGDFNINLVANAFVYQENGQWYRLPFGNLKNVFIDGREFRFSVEAGGIYEVGNNDITYRYEAKLIPASPNPMANRPYDKWVVKTRYYLNNKEISKRKFNKLN